jgi:hypothetical protein
LVLSAGYRFEFLSSNPTSLCHFCPINFFRLSFLLPFFYLFYLFGKTDEEKKEIARKKFIETHLLESENYQAVNQWFENFYAHKKRVQSFFCPPLARDWAVGYTPLINEYCDDLTTDAYQKKITPPLIGKRD